MFFLVADVYSVTSFIDKFCFNNSNDRCNPMKIYHLCFVYYRQMTQVFIYIKKKVFYNLTCHCVYRCLLRKWYLKRIKLQKR